ncbi:MAG: hypothetical protein H7Z37_00390 [Pyrinomonadaceae bacterium]|nr:hypothetical protein [Pyrinomonadaceae bacterium]
MDNFYNTGFGWVCSRCERETQKSDKFEESGLPRMWREGEAETKEPTLSAPMARWLDATRGTLICPKCGITETVYKA